MSARDLLRARCQAAVDARPDLDGLVVSTESAVEIHAEGRMVVRLRWAAQPENVAASLDWYQSTLKPRGTP